MPDLISLTCPSCGGKLQISPSTTILSCPHCGNDHIVKHEAGAITLEAYARCPQCGRNDKAEKVTAVISSQSQVISGTEEKNEVIIDVSGMQRLVTRSVPFTRRQVSQLGQQLAPPDQPQFGPGLQSQVFAPTKDASPAGGILAILVGVTLMLVSASILILGIYLLFSASGGMTRDLLITIIVGLVICVLLFIVGVAAVALGVFLVIRSVKSKRAQIAEHQQKIQAELAERQRIQAAWERAMERWNQLYYCTRDDCVFIPAENTSGSISKMKEYLYK